MIKSIVDIVRLHEGQFDVAEQPTLIVVPSKGVSASRQNTTSPTYEHCPFARTVSYQTQKLYQCVYKNKCDDQITYGTSMQYCRKELEKD